VKEGLACCVWDKPGCGKSEGVYNDGDIRKSAQEAIACIRELKRQQVPGADTVGLWGLSRGGWVCPLIIQNYPSIAFWISVSGPDGEDNFPYLLETNWRIEGRSEEETKALVKSWRSNLDIAAWGHLGREPKSHGPLPQRPFLHFCCKSRQAYQGRIFDLAKNPHDTWGQPARE
jgi:hypothetical protein